MMPGKDLIIKDFHVGTTAVGLQLTCSLFVSGVV